ncbi:MAG: hypothetical protein M3P22_00815 [bacterium]|nr:hypothetical protein [bacterium]
MKKILVIIFAIILGFLLYTFVVALYRANFSADGALPSKNTSNSLNSQDKVIFETTKVSTNELKPERTSIVSGFTYDETPNTNNSNTQNCDFNCQKLDTRSKIWNYIENKNPTFFVYDLVVDINAHTGIVIYKQNDRQYRKDFFYTEDYNGNITSLILR